MIAAQELVSADGVPRRLRCRGLTLSELARELGMRLAGGDGEVAGFRPLSGLSQREDGIAVTYLGSARFAGLLRAGSDIAVITRAELRGHLQEGNAALIVDGDPHDLFYTALATAVEAGKFERLSAFLSPSAKVHPMASIADHVHIEAGATIDAGAVILPNTYIGPDAVIKANATVGGDGYENAVIRGRRAIVPHAGGAWLSEGVRIGSCTCVDKGLFGEFSFLGACTTTDNLVHFAHSCRAGKNCSFTACAEISGSVVLGDGVWLAPNVAINQSLTIGSHCVVGTGSVVTKNLPPHSLAYGFPARVMGKVCVCREKLEFENNLATCARCGRAYQLDESGQVCHA